LTNNTPSQSQGRARLHQIVPPTLRPWLLTAGAFILQIKKGLVRTYQETAFAAEFILEAPRAFPARTQPQVIKRWAGGQVVRDRAAIFCHFSLDNAISDDVVRYVRTLSELGFPVVFVSSSADLSDAAIAPVAPYCAEILLRNNIGYDFGCYREGLLALEPLDRLNGLIIANDSVIGPLAPLEPALRRMDLLAADIWGLTDSRDRGAHLQSYFLFAGPTALHHPAFIKFWRSYPLAQKREWAIRFGELGFSRAMRKAGLRLAAAYPYQELIEQLRRRADAARAKPTPPAQNRPVGHGELLWLIAHGANLNPTHVCWDILRSEYDFPFIKRDLAARNPMRLEHAPAASSPA
jgi:lipopolysaccharide biosynthesis protein